MTIDSGPAVKVTALIPAYNEARTIRDQLDRTLHFVGHVILVDDGSTDGTADLVNRPEVLVKRQPVNFGKGESLILGFQEARNAGYDFVMTLDADGQHRPEDIPRLLARASSDTIVVGSRMSQAHLIPKSRYRANQTANFFISWAAGQWIQDTQCGFRVYPIGLFDKIHLRRQRRSGFVTESEILIEASRAGYRVVTVPVPALYEAVLKRPSHFKPVRDIAAIVLMVTGKLLARWTYPSGLVRSWKQRAAASNSRGLEI